MDRLSSVRPGRVGLGALSIVWLWLGLFCVWIPELASAQDQFEPNDTPQTATVISQSGTTLAATISSTVDIDWFRFQQVQPGAISISMTSIPSGQDYDMELGRLDTQSGQLVSVALSENPPPENELIQLSGSEGIAGDYFLVVYGFDSSFDVSDTYQLSFSFQQGTTNSPPSVSIVQPAGGEQYEVGTQQTIAFTLADPDGGAIQVTVDHSTNNGTSWQELTSGALQTGTHSLLWNVPTSAYSQGRVRVTANDGVASPVSAISNVFSVVSVPTGNNALTVGSNSGTVGSTATVSVGLANEDVVKGLQMDVLFDPAVVSFVGASPVSRAAAFSDSSRTISNGRARVVLFPSGNQTIPAGTGSILNLSFQLVAAGASNITPSALVLSGVTGNPLSVTSSAGVMTVTGSGGGVPQIQLVSPSGGETFAGGSVQTIQYVASGGSGALSIQIAYSSNNGNTYQTQGTDTNDGSFSWAVPNLATTTGKIRVTASDGVNAPATDESGAFTITTSSGGNSVAIASGEGAGGGTVSLPLTLTNAETAKALQFDLNYDESVIQFSSAVASGRGAQMVMTAQRIGTGRARGVLRFQNASTLGAGSGEVASISFSLVGGQGTQSTITPTSLILSDPDANAIAGVTAQSGVISVTSDPPPGAEVAVSVVKNPGRARHLTIFVTVSGGSGSAPVVSVGGSIVSVSALGSGVYKATFFAEESVSNLTVTATDTVSGVTVSGNRAVSF